MPYRVRRINNEWVVQKKTLSGWHILSHHATKYKAKASIRAIYSNDPKEHRWYRE